MAHLWHWALLRALSPHSSPPSAFYPCYVCGYSTNGLGHSDLQLQRMWVRLSLNPPQFRSFLTYCCSGSLSLHDVGYPYLNWGWGEHELWLIVHYLLLTLWKDRADLEVSLRPYQLLLLVVERNPFLKETMDKTQLFVYFFAIFSICISSVRASHNTLKLCIDAWSYRLSAVLFLKLSAGLSLSPQGCRAFMVFLAVSSLLLMMGVELVSVLRSG